jgi:hypothetical protein
MPHRNAPALQEDGQPTTSPTTTDTRLGRFSAYSGQVLRFDARRPHATIVVTLARGGR